MNWGVSEIIGVATFVLAVGGSIARVIWKQAVDSQTISRVEAEVKEIQLRKETLSEQVSKHSTDIAVMDERIAQMFKTIMATLAEIKEKIK